LEEGVEHALKFCQSLQNDRRSIKSGIAIKYGILGSHKREKRMKQKKKINQVHL
jgi:hypothetical protein